jgi:hypothetical protein
VNLLDAETVRTLDGIAKHYRAMGKDGDVWHNCPDEWCRSDEFVVPLAVRAVRQLGLRGEILREVGRWDAKLTRSLTSDDYYDGLTLEEVFTLFERLIEVHYERLEAANG